MFSVTAAETNWLELVSLNHGHWTDDTVMNPISI